MSGFMRNDRGIDALLRGAAARATVEKAARAVADRASANYPTRNQRGFMPRSRTKAVTSGRAEMVTHAGLRTVAAPVLSNDFGWAIAEYGSVKSPPYAPIRTAVRQVGLRLEEPRP